MSLIDNLRKVRTLQEVIEATTKNLGALAKDLAEIGFDMKVEIELSRDITINCPDCVVEMRYRAKYPIIREP